MQPVGRLRTAGQQRLGLLAALLAHLFDARLDRIGTLGELYRIDFLGTGSAPVFGDELFGRQFTLGERQLEFEQFPLLELDERPQAQFRIHRPRASAVFLRRLHESQFGELAEGAGGPVERPSELLRHVLRARARLSQQSAVGAFRIHPDADLLEHAGPPPLSTSEPTLARGHVGSFSPAGGARNRGEIAVIIRWGTVCGS
ncbi:hypothetical protein SVIOM74S_07090 [Streptomyces violarus]